MPCGTARWSAARTGSSGSRSQKLGGVALRIAPAGLSRVHEAVVHEGVIAGADVGHTHAAGKRVPHELLLRAAGMGIMRGRAAARDGVACAATAPGSAHRQSRCKPCLALEMTEPIAGPSPPTFPVRERGRRPPLFCLSESGGRRTPTLSSSAALMAGPCRARVRCHPEQGEGSHGERAVRSAPERHGGPPLWGGTDRARARWPTLAAWATGQGKGPLDANPVPIRAGGRPSDHAARMLRATCAKGQRGGQPARKGPHPEREASAAPVRRCGARRWRSARPAGPRQNRG